MKPRCVRLVLVGLIACTACRAGQPNLQPISYAPRPERIERPADALKSLILANTTQGCVTDPGYAQAMLVVKFVCTSGAGNVVLRFDQIRAIEMLQSGEWYMVRVHHHSGVADFEWTSKSLNDAQHIADAIAAIASRAPAPSAPPTTTM